MNNAILAAISMALYDAEGYNTHDVESGKLTITCKSSEWNCHSNMMTQKP